MPIFLMTSIVSILLVACGVDVKETIPSQTEETIESIDSEEVNSAESTEIVEDVEKETVNPTSQADETEVAEAEQLTVATNELQVKNQEQALNQLLFATHLEKDKYSYYFAEIDSIDFIQIEVREVQEDAEHATLEGVYRYMIETEEVLMRDYLTGDFMPYEEIE